MAKQISGSLKDARSMLDTVGRNIDNTQQPGARAVDTSIKVSPVGKNGAYRTSVVTTRRDDPLKTKILFSSTSSSSKTQTKSSSLSFLQQAIGSGSDLQKSLLVRAVTDFISQSKVLPAVNDVSMKRAFVAKGVALSDALNNATDKVNALRVDADNDLRDGLMQLNSSLKQLHLLNQNILTSRAPQNLYDNRDRLIGEISQKLEVQTYYGHNGVANLMIKGSGYELVSATSRAEFSYPGAKTSDLLTGGTIPAVTITKVSTENGRDKVLSAATPIVGGSDNMALQGMKGGQIEGWINLRDVELPLAGDAIKSLALGVAKAVNGVHNNGSPYPPKTSFRGAKAVLGSQGLDLQGKVTFFAIDQSGAQLAGGAGKLNPATIDFSTFKGKGIGGQPTVLEIIQEINQKLNITPSRARVAIGSISSNGGPVDGQKLINNIQLAGVSDIGGDGRWSFNLDLQGSAYFGSKIEVLGVARDPAGVNQQAEALPPAFTLGKGIDTRTGVPITLGGFVAGGPVVDVAVRVRVTGDNGVVEEGTVTFKVDQDSANENSAKFNGRVAYQTGQANPPVGQIVAAGLTSHTGVAKAMLVDDNGNEITDPSSGVEGHLVIKTNSLDYRLAIQNGDLKDNSMQAGNFSRLFEINNFFDFDETTGKISVSKVINDDPGQLATGMVSLNKGTPTKVTTGTVAASVNLNFLQNFLAVPADTITIDGQVFTFGVAGPGQVPVALGVDLPTSLANLAAQINADPTLRFAAEIVGGGIKLTAKTKGDFGNGLTVTPALNAGNQMNGAGVAVNFAGGVSDPDAIITISDYTIGSSSFEVLINMQNLSSSELDFTGQGIASGEFSSTIEQFATLVSGAISGQYNEAKDIDDVQQEALESLNKEMTKLFGPDLYEQYFYSLELKQFMTVIANYGKMVQNVADRVFDTLFRN